MRCLATSMPWCDRWATLGAGAVVGLVLLTACGSREPLPPPSAAGSSLPAVVPSSPPPSLPPPVTGASTAESVGQCVARHVVPADPQAWEPDPRCTPGSTAGGLDPGQLCPVAHTRAIRPPVSYTGTLKREQLAVYVYPGITPPLPEETEEDHLIPLALGGAPSDPGNLWPEPGPSPNEKDEVENAAHQAVCQGRLALAEAQRRMAEDWYGLGRDLGVVP